MKIAVILPGDYSKEYCDYRHQYLNTFSSKGTELKIVLAGGIPSLRCISDLGMIHANIVQRSIEAEKEGFDGVLIH
jgi:hypothetical protein